MEKFSVDKDLFEDMADYFVKLYKFPPLAAKIYALIGLDFKREGLDFDYLVCYFNSSKGAISSNLKILLNKNLVVGTTKPDERRRLFVVNPDHIRIRFSEILNMLFHEKRLIQKLRIHKKNQQIDNSILEDNFNLFEEYIGEVIIKIESVIRKIK